MGSKSGSKSSGKAAAGKAGRPAKQQQQQQQKQKQNELAAAADDPFASTRSAADAADAADAGSGGLLFSLAWTSVLAYFLVAALISSYDIRTQAIEEYGTVIHEFDPWFNYRATEVGPLLVGVFSGPGPGLGLGSWGWEAGAGDLEFGPSCRCRCCRCCWLPLRAMFPSAQSACWICIRRRPVLLARSLIHPNVPPISSPPSLSLSLSLSLLASPLPLLSTRRRSTCT